jgi:prepilin-type N-terminal cleavage/methylation domain-containing protein/prepilin-type processing-associated H-X9-DG protein
MHVTPMHPRPRRQPDRRRRGSGFTLVELLVVVAVIALLIGVLLPALGAARERAQTVACMVQMRQLVLAQLTYANEHDGQLVDYGLGEAGVDTADEVPWLEELQDYWDSPLTAKSPVDDSRHWPVSRGGAGEPVPGTEGRLRQTSYGLNELLTPTYARTNVDGLPRFDRIERIPSADKTAQWMIMAYDGAFAAADHVHVQNWWLGPFTPPDYPSRIAATMVETAAHGGPERSPESKSNYAFLDGHAATLRFREVYQSNERNAFDPRFPM